MPDQLHYGRESYSQRAWAKAFQSLSQADRSSPLAGDDLELLALSAYLIGREEDFIKILDRAYHSFLDSGNGIRAARCAFWISLRLFLRGETGPANGWLARAAASGA